MGFCASFVHPVYCQSITSQALVAFQVMLHRLWSQTQTSNLMFFIFLFAPSFTQMTDHWTGVTMVQHPRRLGPLCRLTNYYFTTCVWFFDSFWHWRCLILFNLRSVSHFLIPSLWNLQSMSFIFLSRLHLDWYSYCLCCLTWSVATTLISSETFIFQVVFSDTSYKSPYPRWIFLRNRHPSDCELYFVLSRRYWSQVIRIWHLGVFCRHLLFEYQ